MPSKKSRSKQVLVLLAGPATAFVKTDIELLNRHFPVEVLVYPNKRLQMTWWVVQRILRGQVGVILFWFAVPSFGFGISLLARLLRCPIALITGGYDIANMPEIGFGSLIRPRLRKLVIGMLRLADTILPFSDFARREVLRYVQPRRLVVVYPGVDMERFPPPPHAKHEPLVLTTAYSVGAAFIHQKGLDTFVQAAAHVPEARFVLTGQFLDDAARDLAAGAPPNVEFTRRYLSDEELLAYFQQARVYVQASAHEGFGLALAEAMAAGCVPVAVHATAMPEVVGETGFYAPFGDAAAFGEAIRQALQDDGSRARAARERIVNNFTLSHRERILIAEVGRLLKQ